jgi:hypothetical protein
MKFDQLLQWNRHLLLYCAWIDHMARYVEQFGARVTWSAKTYKPASASATNGLEKKFQHCSYEQNGRPVSNTQIRTYS